MSSRNSKVELLSEVMDPHLNDDDRVESKIQKSIMDYLKTVPGSNFAKIAQGPWSKNGVSDIVGCYLGRSVVIEVKRKTGKPTELQKVYLNNNIRAGGFAALSRSVADARAVLEKVKKQVKDKT
ncbi:MAG: VRR-NUC domain-containing protein [Candidatus Latescibacterota bacterium]|nr:MAG: VRR-NUC domain-containing protein [Candidatus Latescibacterota bacterium]